jgi:hypothetical protein
MRTCRRDELEDNKDANTNIEFSGEGTAVVQAGAVHGGVHVHESPVADLPAPRQLPGGTAGFVNRESILEELDALLASLSDGVDADAVSTVVVSAITGAPGVGKTALATHWAHQVRHMFPDGGLLC